MLSSMRHFHISHFVSSLKKNILKTILCIPSRSSIAQIYVVYYFKP